MKLGNYPNELTEEDSDAGFRVLGIECPGTLFHALGISFQDVVAYPLSDSDVIMRLEDASDGSPRYMLLRWGRSQLFNREPDEWCEWHIADSACFADPRAAIQGFQFDEPKPKLMVRILRERFKVSE